MWRYNLILSVLLLISLSQSVLSAVLEQVFNGITSCENDCERQYSASSNDLRKSCSEGCRLYTIIGLAKGLPNTNKTLTLCLSACAEAFNKTSVEACNYGCQRDAVMTTPNDEPPQTLHLLTPLMYVKSAYSSMAHHVKQFVSTSWTVYIQEDSGKMVVLQTNPKVVEHSDHASFKESGSSVKGYQQSWQEDRLDWMDCISHQSGLPRWLLVVVLFGFIFALLWLCCATTVTAPNQHVSSTQKKSEKKNVGYVLLCEPDFTIKPPVSPNEEAPPLPPKVIPI